MFADKAYRGVHREVDGMPMGRWAQKGPAATGGLPGSAKKQRVISIDSTLNGRRNGNKRSVKNLVDGTITRKRCKL